MVAGTACRPSWAFGKTGIGTAAQSPHQTSWRNSMSSRRGEYPSIVRFWLKLEKGALLLCLSFDIFVHVVMYVCMYMRCNVCSVCNVCNGM